LLFYFHEKNLELFKRLAGRLLAKCAEEFPGGIKITSEKLLETEGLEPSNDHLKVANGTVQWLEEEGFSRVDAVHAVLGTMDKNFRNVRLTKSGLAAMNVTITLGEQKGRAGDLLIEQLKMGSADARKAAISEIVGGIIGAAGRAWTGF
jgi:hypothetical protein